MKIAIIPARGGSKRIPRKNIKIFSGKPIISYSIESALESDLFDEVMVSTDDEEIARIAKKLGANVPFLRSSKNSDDFATTAEVMIEVLNGYKSEKNVEYADLCCIYPTAPFITAQKLVDSFRLFIIEAAEALIPVVKFSYPPQRAFCINNGVLAYIEPEYMNNRSQDLEPYYHDAGQFYWVKVKSLQDAGSLTSGKVIPFILNELEVQDLDSIEDWRLAELKHKLAYL